MKQFDIVISGISGRFPESSNIQEFEENLLKNVDMVTVNDRRFTSGLYGIPEGFGALKEIDKCDSQFFGISPVEGRRMDPQLRMALEVSYEAMVDAGKKFFNNFNCAYLTRIFLSQALVLIRKEEIVPEYFTLFAQVRLE
jgi:acyl transferase domain-containing protein